MSDSSDNNDSDSDSDDSSNSGGSSNSNYENDLLNQEDQININDLFNSINNNINENIILNTNENLNIQSNLNLLYRPLSHITITNELQIILNQMIEIKILELTTNIDNDINSLNFYNEQIFNILNEINNEYIITYNFYQDNIYLIIKYSVETSFTNLINMRIYTESEIIRYIYTYFYYSGNNYYVNNINYIKECIINVLKKYLKDKILYEMTLSINQQQQNQQMQNQQYQNQQYQNQQHQNQQMQDVKNVLTIKQFDDLHQIVYKNLDINIKKINEKCLICMDIFTELDELKLIKCNHCFHIDCIKPWLTEQSCKCPNCRFELEHINVL